MCAKSLLIWAILTSQPAPAFGMPDASVWIDPRALNPTLSGHRPIFSMIKTIIAEFCKFAYSFPWSERRIYNQPNKHQDALILDLVCELDCGEFRPDDIKPPFEHFVILDTGRETVPNGLVACAK